MPLRILVIDDDLPSLDALRELLEAEGYEVVCATNGQEALDRLRESHAFGVILLDVMMPGMNGFEFREKQLEDPVLAAIPVIVLTAGRRATEYSAQLGPQRSFQKPLSPPALLQAIRDCCASDGARLPA